jgi:hypothetical protein
MSRRSPSACRSWILAAALVAATGGVASVGRSQQVFGSIGVSLTILEPIAAPGLRVTGFDVSRDGIAGIETTVSSSVRTSQLVMTRIWSSTAGFALEHQPPVLVAPSSGALRTRYRVSIARERRRDHARPTELRVEYLIVAAGT